VPLATLVQVTAVSPRDASPLKTGTVMLTAHAQIPAASRDKIMDRTSTPPCLFFIQCAHFLVEPTCVRCLTFTENP
jgi:hypothetical protein